MKMMAWKFFLPVVLCTLMLVSSSLAGSGGQTTADFLNFYVDARSAALGGSYVAIVDDATASYWNPGGLANVSSRQVVFSHFAWYQDMTFEYLAIATPVGKKVTLSAGVSYVNYGTIEGYDRYDNPTGPLASTYDMAGAFSIGYKANESFYVGTTVKFITMSLDNNTFSGMAFDVGAQMQYDNFTAGVALVNFGSPISMFNQDENLPTALRLGVAYYPIAAPLTITAEVEKRFHDVAIVKGGTEYTMMDNYFLRVGYEFSPGQEVRTVDRSFSLGMGATIGKSRIDYTFSPSYIIGAEEIHRFTLSFDF